MPPFAMLLLDHEAYEPNIDHYWNIDVDLLVSVVCSSFVVLKLSMGATPKIKRNHAIRKSCRRHPISTEKLYACNFVFSK